MGPIPMNPTCPRCGGKHGVEVSGDDYEHDCAACGGHLICAIGDEGEMYPWHRAGDGGDDDEADATDDSPGDLSLDDYLDRMVAGTLSRPGREELAAMVRTMTPLADAAWDWAESTRVSPPEGDHGAENHLLEQAQNFFNRTPGRR